MFYDDEVQINSNHDLEFNSAYEVNLTNNCTKFVDYQHDPVYKMKMATYTHVQFVLTLLWQAKGIIISVRPNLTFVFFLFCFTENNPMWNKKKKKNLPGQHC